MTKIIQMAFDMVTTGSVRELTTGKVFLYNGHRRLVAHNIGKTGI